VQGGLNSGGIVGQNQVDAIVRRSYSTAAISVRAAQGAKGSGAQQGAGGIAGYNSVGSGTTNSAGLVENCVALNPSITSSGGFDLIYRITGDGNGSQRGNLARTDMQITISGSPSTKNDPGADAKDGANCEAKPVQSVYEGLGWDFSSIWEMDSDGYPVLKWQE
jgi:hypothetical protein